MIKKLDTDGNILDEDYTKEKFIADVRNAGFVAAIGEDWSEVAEECFGIRVAINT